MKAAQHQNLQKVARRPKGTIFKPSESNSIFDSQQKAPKNAADSQNEAFSASLEEVSDKDELLEIPAHVKAAQPQNLQKTARQPKGTIFKPSDSNSIFNPQQKAPKNAADCQNEAFSASLEEVSSKDELPETANSIEESLESVIIEEVEDFGETEAAAAVTLEDVDVKLVVALLLNVHAQSMNSADIDFRGKKVLDAVIKIAIVDLVHFQSEPDQFHELLRMKVCSAILCAFFLALAWLVLLRNTSAGSSFSDIPPT